MYMCNKVYKNINKIGVITRINKIGVITRLFYLTLNKNNYLKLFNIKKLFIPRNRKQMCTYKI